MSPDQSNDDSELASVDPPQDVVRKRRRTPRACDECRRKKVKCNGTQPCNYCSTYGYECTYDKPSHRRRGPTKEYIESLETRMHRAEGLLHHILPYIDLEDPRLDPSVQEELLNMKSLLRTDETDPPPEPAEDSKSQSETELLSTIKNIGQLDLTEGGDWNFHGMSSGAVFLSRLKEHLHGLMAHDYQTPFLPRSMQSSHNITALYRVGDSNAELGICEMPPRDEARSICSYSLNYATCLLRIVHVPSFYAMFDKLYGTPPEMYTREEKRFLPLFYAVLSLGCMYKISENDPSNPNSYKTAMVLGFKYYNTARLLVRDVTECRDMTTLQALLFMIHFLQATSNLRGCYALVGVAHRSALSMGLHRHLPQAKMTLIEDEVRRRVFHVIRHMDVYITTILGFPLLLNAEDIDQPLPTEVDDEYITKNGLLSLPPGTRPSIFEAFNANARLTSILAKVVKYIYPLKGAQDPHMNKESSTCMISYSRIQEIEQDLYEWYEKLPPIWRPSSEGPVEVIRVRILLRCTYAYVQMMLYRPFLHYISPRLSDGKLIDKRAYAFAAAGIVVSRNVIHIGLEIRKQGVLMGPYWFILYTQFLAIMSLVFYVLENPDKPDTSEILCDAISGKDTIARFAQLSLAADGVTGALNSLFERLPESLDISKRHGVKQNFAVRPKAAASSGDQYTQPINAANKNHQGNGMHGPGFMFHEQHTETPTDQAGPPGGEHCTTFVHGPVHSAPVHGFSTLTNSGATLGKPVTSHLSSKQPLSQVPCTTVDSMMFPSEDPFEYPRQMCLDVNSQEFIPHLGNPLPSSGGMGLFNMPEGFGDIEAQLLGQVPMYIGESWQQHGSNGFGNMFDSNIYGQH